MPRYVLDSGGGNFVDVGAGRSVVSKDDCIGKILVATAVLDPGLITRD